ncbi:MAG: hypothetical protein WBX01_03565 [Nitrososphaeraceae archaeon]
MTERRIINPWKWQDKYGFVQANEIRGAEKFLVCSGQTAIDSEGNTAFSGDIAAQFKLSNPNFSHASPGSTR